MSTPLSEIENDARVPSDSAIGVGTPAIRSRAGSNARASRTPPLMNTRKPGGTYRAAESASNSRARPAQSNERHPRGSDRRANDEQPPPPAHTHAPPLQPSPP